MPSLSLLEAAEKYGVSDFSIRRWVKRGYLPPHQRLITEGLRSPVLAPVGWTGTSAYIELIERRIRELGAPRQPLPWADWVKTAKR